jgi:hypothetical protein
MHSTKSIRNILNTNFKYIENGRRVLSTVTVPSRCDAVIIGSNTTRKLDIFIYSINYVLFHRRRKYWL